MSDKQQLNTAREHALALEKVVNDVVIGQHQAIRLILIALHSRGHVLLEGGVGVGKTTLLRAFSKALAALAARCSARRCCCFPRLDTSLCLAKWQASCFPW